MTSRVIVHADDFGLSQAVNEGILSAHLRGILTSTSIMAVGRRFEEAVGMARENPTLDVGAHLTLVEEMPLCRNGGIDSLLGEDGAFVGDAQAFVLRSLQGKIDAQHVRRELNAQLEKIFDSGLVPSHIDSHQHVHVIPSIRREVIDLAGKYGIRWVRNPRMHLKPYMFRRPELYKRIVQMMVLDFFCRSGTWKGVQNTSVFSGFFHGGRMNTENLSSLIDGLPENCLCEIMCHPGTEPVDDEYKHWGYHWKSELDALVSDEVRVVVQRKSIELTSFEKTGH